MAQDNWKQDKKETNCQPLEGPVMCINNCGFFGSAVTLGMCSKCYRNHVLTQAKASSTKSVDKELAMCVSKEHFIGQKNPERTQSESSYLTTHLSSEQQEVGGTSSKGGTSANSDQEPCCPLAYRCFLCKKRVGLTGFKCRCGNTFCSLHRYSDKHSCTYDYKTAGRDAIAKANPVVKADKVDKI